jgi:YVTN family beta-propeller protein
MPTAPVSIAVGTGPVGIAANEVTHKVYVANYYSGDVTVIDALTNGTRSVAVGGELEGLVVEPRSNKVYVTSFNPGAGPFRIAVIDGATNVVTPLDTPGVRGVVVNPADGKVYIGAGSDVVVIDAANHTTSKINVGKGSGVLGVDATANKVYVSTAAGLAAIDGTTNTTSTVKPGFGSGRLVVQPRTHRLYAETAQGVEVLDGTTFGTIATLPMKRIDNLILNAAADTVYVLDNGYPNPGTVTVIDGASNATSTVPVGRNALNMAVDQVANKVYVSDTDSDDVTVIDGATKATTTWRVSNGPRALAVDSTTGRVYVGNGGKAGAISSSPGAYTMTVFPGARAPGAVPTVPRDTCMPSPPPPAPSHQC